MNARQRKKHLRWDWLSRKCPSCGDWAYWYPRGKKHRRFVIRCCDPDGCKRSLFTEKT